MSWTFMAMLAVCSSIRWNKSDATCYTLEASAIYNMDQATKDKQFKHKVYISWEHYSSFNRLFKNNQK